ncbi:hypothetical protein CC1G_04003 [Coprinopsis cinerea okayama7|uniref:Uncharacterized protein n=1 Tax=Coprinopsis cinerea (strain Okayama-7 / 130 / ATCC MYA-4618 / FGSC 9003) TaxID=240176 RepID=A8N8F6_COPC7|nr:hypothetical protein CC1G_04003 [Coprinopsis cinerea okayama7\|eukprot:XP_001831112.1 hypothetical protein CC1G_04003 [Coprinopsis cinerea okayama7\
MGRLNRRHYNLKHKTAAQRAAEPREKSPAPLGVGPLPDGGPFGGPGDPNDPEYNPDHPLYWRFGTNAGGMILRMKKHYGERMNNVPYKYLKWCYKNLKFALTFRKAFEAYDKGLRNWIQELGGYGDILVPIGKTYKGLPLKECRDKEWMEWLMEKMTPAYKEDHEIFFLAIKVWLENPNHQGVKRDVGESLAKSRFRDEHWLLSPDEYDLDLAEDLNVIPCTLEDIGEVDEHGNLEGFIASDSQDIVYESDNGTSVDSLSDLDAKAEKVAARIRRNKTGQTPRKSPKKRVQRRDVESDGEATEYSSSDDSYQETVVASDDEPPPKTPRAKATRRLVVSDQESSGDELPSVSPLKRGRSATSSTPGSQVSRSTPKRRKLDSPEKTTKYARKGLDGSPLARPRQKA